MLEKGVKLVGFISSIQYYLPFVEIRKNQNSTAFQIVTIPDDECEAMIHLALERRATLHAIILLEKEHLWTIIIKNFMILELFNLINQIIPYLDDIIAIVNMASGEDIEI